MALKSLRRALRRLIPRSVREARERRAADARRRRFKGLERQETFERIYEENLWGGDPGHFNSGRGSQPEFTSAYVAAVRDYLRDDRIERVVDLGCGDFRVGTQLLTPDLRYVGVDIVRPLIERNQQTFGGPNVEFCVRDLARDTLPVGDVALIRQVLQHLSNDEIGLVLANCRQYRRLIITEHLPVGADVVPNLDKAHGPDIRITNRSGVFVEQPPFSLATRTLLETSVGSREVLRTVLVEQ